ncbi:hypothetical protein Dimus_021977 [Dionaea muscipula]
MVMTNMKLKIKVGASKPGGAMLAEFIKKENPGKNGAHLSGDANGENELDNMRSSGFRISDSKMAPALDNMQTKSSIMGSKRALEGTIEVPKQKRLKMDRGMALKCSDILRKLMKHSAAWIFNQPVDPVALNIPDYFSIVSKPMDLGTIKSKLDKNIYHVADEFESDVKLTFSNAMLYNPPTNHVHRMAKEMDAMFDTLWRPVGANTSRPRIDVKKKVEATGKSDVSNTCLEMLPAHFDRAPKRSTPADEKMKAMDKESSADRLPRSNIEAVKDGKSKCSRDSVIVRRDPDSAGAVRCPAEECSRFPSTHAGSFPKSTGRLGENTKVESMKGTSLRKKVQASETEVAKSWNCSKSQLVRSDPDSDGAVSSLEEEGSCTGFNYRSTSSAVTSECCEAPNIDLQLSPQRALRAAILKKRFADTILKAQRKTLPHQDGKADVIRIEQEKRRFEKKQNGEAAKIEAQLMALKLQRQREREAARLQLERMEKSADIDDNLYSLKELETLVGDCSTCYSHSSRRCNTILNHFDNGRVGSPLSPLERLGLFIKAEEDDEVDGTFFE